MLCIFFFFEEEEVVLSRSHQALIIYRGGGGMHNVAESLWGNIDDLHQHAGTVHVPSFMTHAYLQWMLSPPLKGSLSYVTAKMLELCRI